MEGASFEHSSSETDLIHWLKYVKLTAPAAFNVNGGGKYGTIKSW